MNIVIPVENMKVAHCAICGRYIGPEPALIWFKLNNGGVMAQPSCHQDIKKHEEIEYQKAILVAAKKVWRDEITNSGERSAEEKKRDIQLLMDLEIVE